MVKLEQIKTEEAFLAFERESLDKNEFLYNTIIPMAGASFEHNVIVGNLFGLIWFHLRKSKNFVFQNDMRTHNPVNKSYMYPDVVVSDGKPIFKDSEMDNLINPLLIIEVLSSTTAIYDKTDKFIACKSIPSLQEYVLISPDAPDVEIYQRDSDEHWSLIKYTNPEAEFHLKSINFSCILNEIYEKR